MTFSTATSEHITVIMENLTLQLNKMRITPIILGINSNNGELITHLKELYQKSLIKNPDLSTVSAS